jgi:hypothetical protein
MLLTLSTNLIFGQNVVSAPILEQQGLKSLVEQFQQTQIYTKMLAHQNEIKEAMESYEVIKNLETVNKLYNLVETMACATKDFEFYLQFTADYNDCITKIEFDKMLVKFEASSDILFLIFGGAKLVQSGDRIKSLEDAIKLLEDAYNDMMRMQTNIRYTMNESIINNYLNSSANEYNISRY